MEQFRDAHFFYMPSQGNIYTMAELQLASGCKKLLVASLKREIFCFEYQESSTGTLVPTARDISFTYIPNAAEIISLDAFNKSPKSNEFVIGITIIKNSNDADSRLETYLNIYSEWEESEDFNIDNIAQNCLTVELNFIPYKLCHTHLVTWNDDEIQCKEIVFILSGSDNQVHIFKESTTEHNYRELEGNSHFPEFSKTPSPVIWIDICYLDNFTRRITSFVCECGYVKLLVVDVKANKLIYNFSTIFGNYISKVQIYLEKDKTDLPFKNEFVKFLNDDKTDNSENDTPNINMVVVNSILPAVVFHNVLKYGLSDFVTLPRHEYPAVLTSCEVADIDFDGQKEILITNSSEEIMLLKRDKVGDWYLEEIKKISGSILGIKYIDMDGDGVKDLVIFSTKGVHILQVTYLLCL
nr:unnamed protein product [Callosobruchus chinensis]